MADTTFVSTVTVIARAWLQDINDFCYKFLFPGTGAVSTDIQRRGQQQRWLWDFLSETQRTAIVSTGKTDCSAAFQAAHDSLPTGGGVINIGPGGFAIGSTVTLSKPITLRGE